MGLASCLEFPRPQVDRCPLRDLGLLGGIRAASFDGPRLVEGKQASTAGSQPSWAPPCACSEDLQQDWRLVREDHTWNRTKPTGFPPRVQPAVILPPRNEGEWHRAEKMYNKAGKRDLGPGLAAYSTPQGPQQSCLMALSGEGAGSGEGPPFLDRPSSGESSAGHSRRGGPPTALAARPHPFEFCRVCKENKGCIWALGFPSGFIWADPGQRACT